MCINALSVPVFAVTRPMCVVLDAGHGGIDGGVVGRETGVKESDVNLAVTMKLKTVLERAGFDVVLTRKTEAGLYGRGDPKGFKRRDMSKRKEIIEEAKPIVMISRPIRTFIPRAPRAAGRCFIVLATKAGKSSPRESKNNSTICTANRASDSARPRRATIICSNAPTTLP